MVALVVTVLLTVIIQCQGEWEEEGGGPGGAAHPLHPDTWWGRGYYVGHHHRKGQLSGPWNWRSLWGNTRRLNGDGARFTLRGTHDATSVSGGMEPEVMDDATIQQFGLSELRQAIKAYTGVSPTHVYTRAPASGSYECFLCGSYPDLYDGRNYAGGVAPKQVTVSVSASVLHPFHESIGERVAVVANATFRNNGAGPIVIRETLTHTVEDSLEVTFSETVSNTIFAKAECQIKVVNIGGGWERKTTVGKEETTTRASKIGTSTQLDIPLQVGEGVSVQIISTLQQAEAVLEYTATLDGKIVTYFYYKWKNQYFHGFHVQDILDVNKLPRTAQVTQSIKTGYFFNKAVVVKNISSHEVLGVIHVSDGDSGPIVLRVGDDGFYHREFSPDGDYYHY